MEEAKKKAPIGGGGGGRTTVLKKLTFYRGNLSPAKTVGGETPWKLQLSDSKKKKKQVRENRYHP